MNAIDPARHPQLHHVEQGAQWAGQDDFPASEEWADEVEKWVVFAAAAVELGRYLPRLRGPGQRRDETLMELAIGYFLQSKCGFPVIGWEPPGVGGKLGEYLIKIGPASTFVEVKSPGWEDEICSSQNTSTTKSWRLRRGHLFDMRSRKRTPSSLIRCPHC